MKPTRLRLKHVSFLIRFRRLFIGSLRAQLLRRYRKVYESTLDFCAAGKAEKLFRPTRYSLCTKHSVGEY
jgi:hypothetical protein